MSKEADVREDSFPSDEEFDEEDCDSDSSSNVDEKLAEDDVFDTDFFKCYSALKKKDEKIYDKNVKFFTAEATSSSDEDGDKSREDGEKSSDIESLKINKRPKGPKMTLLDHQLGLKDDEIENPGGEPKIDLSKPVSKSFYEKELEEIKKSIEKVSENIDSESDDDLLTVKGAGAIQSRPRRMIKTMLDKLEEDGDQDIKHLKQLWSDPKQLTDEDKFLRDYILNKRYLPTDIHKNEDDKGGFFSKNLDDMSDADSNDKIESEKKHQVEHRSDEKDFDRITRIPRNSTKTIRDLVEKREKKEKRLKGLEKEKKRKKAIKDADFEDLVGDLPTRFHYRETEPNDYGLSAEELLMATDEELEKWVHLHEAIGYKTREEELAQKKRFDQKRNDLALKKKVFKSIYGDTGAEDPVGAPDTQPRSSKAKKRKRNSGTVEEPQVAETPLLSKERISDDVEQANLTNKRKKKHKRGLAHKKFAKVGVAPDRLLAYGLSKTKLKKSKLL